MFELLQWIHRHWSSVAPLTQLVPSERLFSGIARSPTAVPYVVLQPGETETQFVTSSGTRVAQAPVEFHLWTADLQTAEQLRTAVEAAFDRHATELPTSRLLNMRMTTQTQTQPEPNRWRTDLTYIALLESTH